MQVLIIYLIYFIINYSKQMSGGSKNVQLSNKHIMNYILFAFVIGNFIFCACLWADNCRLGGQVKQMKNVIEKYDSMLSSLKNMSKIDVEELVRSRAQLSQKVEQMAGKTQKLEKKIQLLQTILQKIFTNKLKSQFGIQDENESKKQSIIQQAKQSMTDIAQQLKQKVSALNQQYQILETLSENAEGFKNRAVDSTVYLKQKLAQKSAQFQQKLMEKGEQIKQFWKSFV